MPKERPPYKLEGRYAYPSVDVGRLRLLGDIPALLTVYRDGDVLSAEYAIEALDDLGDASDASVFLECLANYEDDPSLAAAAAYALGRRRDKRAVEPLIALLRYEYSNISEHQVAAAWALGEIGDVRAVEALIGQVPSSWLSTAALDAIGRIGAAEAVPLLVERLRDPKIWWTYPDLARAARTLGEIGDPGAIDVLSEMLLAQERSASLKLARHRPITWTGVGGPIFQQKRSRPVVRRAAASALAQISSPDATEPLRLALNDEDDETAAISRRALNPPGAAESQRTEVTTEPPPADKHALLDAVTEGTVRDRGAAIDALGELKILAAVSPLLRLLADVAEPAGLRARAARALGRIGDQRAEESLRRALDDASEAVRLRSAEALGAWPGEATVRDLLSRTRAEADSDTRRESIRSLARMGTSGTRALASLLDDAHFPLRAEVIRALGASRDPAAAAALGRVISTEDTGTTLLAVAALANIDSPNVIEPLKRALALDGRQFEIQELAVTALARFDSREAIEAVISAYSRGIRAARVGLNAIAARAPDLHWLVEQE